MSIPEELERRDERLKKLAEARTKIAARTQIAARAAGRLIREQAAHEGKVAARAATAKARGKKLGGRPPAPPAAGPGPADQINPTDADSRIMPVAGGGFAQCCNAPAVVTADRLLVAATDVVQAANDEQQGRAASRADAGQAGDGAGGSGPAADDARRQWPFQRGQCGGLRCGRDRAAARARPYPHHPSLDRRFATAPPAPTNPTPLAAMVHHLATPHGKKLYARRKHTPEPGFGIIKSVLGFRQFLLRGLDKVRGEWSLVTMACNMKRILALATRPREHWAIVTQPPPGQPATLRQVSNRFSLALSTQLGVPSLDQLNSSPTGC